jgi:hypothetical protein
MSKSIYPSIPAPGNDMPSINATLGAMRQSLNMLILNAQNPNPNFSPSAASQVFVTYDQLQKMGVQGQPGPQGAKGDQGLPGPPGTSGGTPVPPSSQPPLMDGIASPGSSGAYAHGDHVHPTDTSLLAATSPVFTVLPIDAANDAAAATAGVPLRGVYRNGSVLMIRTV